MEQTTEQRRAEMSKTTATPEERAESLVRKRIKVPTITLRDVDTLLEIASIAAAITEAVAEEREAFLAAIEAERLSWPDPHGDTMDYAGLRACDHLQEFVETRVKEMRA
jgi:hypothetical protein